MDRENLLKLKEILDEIAVGNVPSDEELDYDPVAIDMYDTIFRLKAVMEDYGFDSNQWGNLWKKECKNSLRF